MANKTTTATSVGRLSTNEQNFVEGWLPCLIVWIACIGTVLSIACFLLGQAE